MNRGERAPNTKHNPLCTSKEGPPMSAALAEPIDAIKTDQHLSQHRTGRGQQGERPAIKRADLAGREGPEPGKNARKG